MQVALTWRVLTPIIGGMPNSPSKDKKQVGVRIPLGLLRELEAEAGGGDGALQRLILRVLFEYKGAAGEEYEAFMNGSRHPVHRARRAAAQDAAPSFVMGDMWLSLLRSTATGWQLALEEDGFELTREAFPGCVGVRFQEGCYTLYAGYFGGESRTSFSAALKRRYQGRRVGGMWRSPLHAAPLELDLRPVAEGGLFNYLRTGQDDAVVKLRVLLAKLISRLMEHHRRALWYEAAQNALEPLGWFTELRDDREKGCLLHCCRAESHPRWGVIALEAHEPRLSDLCRITLTLPGGDSARLRHLLHAMQQPQLCPAVRHGKVELAEQDFELTADGDNDYPATAAAIAATLAQWARGIDSALLSPAATLRDFAALVVDTANLSPGSVCSLAVVIVRDGQIAASHHHLIHPGEHEFDPHATEFHGISADQVANAPSFADVWARLAPAIGDLPLIVHHNFHRRALLTHLPAEQYTFCDTHPIARARYPEQDVSLPSLAALMGLPQPEATSTLARATVLAHIAPILLSTPH